MHAVTSLHRGRKVSISKCPHAGASQGDVARHLGVCRATINRFWVTTTQEAPTNFHPNRLRQVCLQARRPVRCNVLTAHHLAVRLDFGVVKTIFDGVLSGEQLSLQMPTASRRSEQMDVPESIDVVMNVMSPIVW